MASDQTAINQSVDVTIDCVADADTIRVIEAAVREAAARAGISEGCTVAVAPQRVRPGWTVGIVRRWSDTEWSTTFLSIDAAPRTDVFVQVLADALRGVQRIRIVPTTTSPAERDEERAPQLRLGNPPRWCRPG